MAAVIVPERSRVWWGQGAKFTTVFYAVFVIEEVSVVKIAPCSPNCTP